MIPVWDDHPPCFKCRFSAVICYVDIHNPCSICQSWLTITWGKLRKSLRDARQKSVKQGTQQGQHWSRNIPTLLVWMDSASTSAELLSETVSIAESDLRDVDLELADVTAPTQIVEVSVHQGSVEEPPAIDAGQAPTMDNVIPVPLCAELIACAHVLPLASTFKQLLLTSAVTAAPLLIMGHSFPPVTQGPISTLPGAPIAFSCAPGAPVASTPYASAFKAPPAWPMYMPCYMPRPLTQPLFIQAQFEELARQHQDIEARELEVQRMSRTLNLNAVRNARIR